MELQRRVGAGNLSAIVGPDALPIDKEVRKTKKADHIRRMVLSILISLITTGSFTVSNIRNLSSSERFFLIFLISNRHHDVD